MKKRIITVFILLLLSTSLWARENRVSWGFHIDAGGRYDDLRMCVASAAGIKGGPMADVYFDLGVRVGEDGRIIFSLPFMRPVLFGIGFKMLQFEPLINFQYRFGEYGQKWRPVLGAGVGLSLHWGPDYTSDLDNPGESFFAAGPIVNVYFGVERGIWTLGIRAFYEPLFSNEYEVGTVIGGAIIAGISLR